MLGLCSRRNKDDQKRSSMALTSYRGDSWLRVSVVCPLFRFPNSDRVTKQTHFFPTTTITSCRVDREKFSCGGCYGYGTGVFCSISHFTSVLARVTRETYKKDCETRVYRLPSMLPY
eukprot:scaffold4740_cov165-Amphora_coffeaeformis.AAC.20